MNSNNPNGPLTVIGSYVSPYVRKVLAVLELKRLAYRIDPIVPFMGDDRFSRLSPLRRVPVLVDGDLTLCDSTVICEYLDDRYPAPAAYPREPAARARARWLEEFADSRMGDVFVWHYFNHAVLRPHVLGLPTDEAVVARALTEEIPQVLAYLEPQLPETGFLHGALSVADISVASFYRTAWLGRYRVDAARWPRFAGFVGRVLAEPCLARLQPFELLMMRTPPAQQREALGAAGAPLTADTVGTGTPRPGVMGVY